jgi:hypothetical protein
MSGLDGKPDLLLPRVSILRFRLEIKTPSLDGAGLTRVVRGYFRLNPASPPEEVRSPGPFLERLGERYPDSYVAEIASKQAVSRDKSPLDKRLGRK